MKPHDKDIVFENVNFGYGAHDEKVSNYIKNLVIGT